MARDFAHKPSKAKQAKGSNIPPWVWYFTSIVAISFIGFLFFLKNVPEEKGGAEAIREQLSKALQKTQPEKKIAPEKPKNETLDNIKDKAETLKEAFQFYQLLENDEVSIDLPNGLKVESSPSKTTPPKQIAPTPKPVTETTSTTTTKSTSLPSSQTTNTAPQVDLIPQGNEWIIQVASFKSIEDADSVRAQLILNGLPQTNISTVDLGTKGTFHRVIVGPFTDKPELTSAKSIVESLKFAVIVKAQ